MRLITFLLGRLKIFLVIYEDNEDHQKHRINGKSNNFYLSKITEGDFLNVTFSIKWNATGSEETMSTMRTILFFISTFDKNDFQISFILHRMHVLIVFEMEFECVLRCQRIFFLLYESKNNVQGSQSRPITIFLFQNEDSY